ncbi:MAG: hypothetical protein AAB370_07915 [Verrucomicrobiota bacterium]
MSVPRTISAQNSAEIAVKVKFPKIIRHRRIEATIYGKTPNYSFYRLAYYVAGKRQLRNFKTYKEAKDEAERKVREIADGSQAAALTADQSRDALAALQRLETLRQTSGRRYSLLAAVSGFADNVGKLNGRSIDEAVDGYMQTTAVVQRKGLSEAVEEFIENRKHKSIPTNGKRAQNSYVYACNVASWLRKFATTFTGTAVCDLSKDHLDKHFKSLTKVAGKSRNDQRAAVKMFLSWSVRKDYLPVNNRLFEADGLAREGVESAETDFYRPKEFKAFLDNANADLLPVIALGGLAGLRVEEIMRLGWEDVWRVAGHIEISAKQAKTRQRRLVEICPTLAELLASYRDTKGAIWTRGKNAYNLEFPELRQQLEIPSRRNGLRHAFCTYHLALHTNENMTAAQAGNSPAMIHAHYKGLATKPDAEKWFAVKQGNSAHE